MKNILVVGKEFPDSKEFGETLLLKERTVVLTCLESDTEDKTSDQLRITQWNKSSPLSARSLVLFCENFKGKIDEAILYFDEPLASSRYETSGTKNCAQILDSYIAGYQFLTFELLERGVKKIVFIHKTNYSLSQAVTSSQAQVARLSNPIISSCGAAFDAFAENMAAEIYDRQKTIPVLIRSDSANETMQFDNNFANWLASYLDSLDNLKNPLTKKQTVTWVKPGAKNPGGFSLFK